MAGYFLSSVDGPAFEQVTTNPTDEQARTLADGLLEEYAGEIAAVGWPADPAGLAGFIKTRLAAPDWYGDLPTDGDHDPGPAGLWDEVVRNLYHLPELDGQMCDYESIYWDCAEFCEEHGATALSEPGFGNAGFRCPPPGKLRDSGYDRMSTIHSPAAVRAMHEQLKLVEPHAAALPDYDRGDEDDESVGGQFFLGLLPAVADAAARGRYLWIETDT